MLHYCKVETCMSSKSESQKARSNVLQILVCTSLSSGMLLKYTSAQTSDLRDTHTQCFRRSAHAEVCVIFDANAVI